MILVWLLSVMPTPVRDPFRYLHHAPSPVAVAVDRPSAVVAWGALPSEDEADEGDTWHEEVPEYAQDQPSFFPDMPNIQPKARVTDIVETAVEPAMPPAEDAGNSVSVSEEGKVSPTTDASQPMAEDARDNTSILENATSVSGGATDTDVNLGNSATVSVAENAGSGVSRGGHAGKDASGHAENQGGGRSVLIDEEALWKAYAQALTRYFAQKRSYPAVARRLGQQGIVWIDIELMRSGEISDITLAKSSGYKSLDDAALELVRGSHDIPPFPEHTTAQKKKIRIPLEYALRRP